MSKPVNPAINPLMGGLTDELKRRVAFVDLRQSIVPVPWYWGAIGLRASELGYLTFQYLNANNRHKLDGLEGANNIVWKQYRTMLQALKIGPNSVSRMNQLFERVGIWRISRPNQRRASHKSAKFTTATGDSIDIGSNVYDFSVIDLSGSDGYTDMRLVNEFRRIIAAEREAIDQYYRQNKGNLRPRKRGKKLAPVVE